LCHFVGFLPNKIILLEIAKRQLASRSIKRHPGVDAIGQRLITRNSYSESRAKFPIPFAFKHKEATRKESANVADCCIPHAFRLFELAYFRVIADVNAMRAGRIR